MHDPIAWIAERLGPEGRCLLMPNGGNLGDALIAAATIQRLERAGIRWSLLRGQRATARTGDVLAFGGGGSLVPLYDGGRACVESLLALGLPLGLPLVVLPQSVRGHAALWSSARGVTVFCRELPSLEYVRGFAHLASLPAHDMATGLDLSVDPFATVRAIREAHAARGETRILRAFRNDPESARPREAQAVEPQALDLAGLAHPSMESVASILAHASAFLAAIATYGAIETDRLHVAVAGGLLAIPTTLYDNVYGKNRAVHEMTLAERFPTVRWADGPPPP